MKKPSGKKKEKKNVNSKPAKEKERAKNTWEGEKLRLRELVLRRLGKAG